MGRVYDALKRAEGQPRTSVSETSLNREGSGDNLSYFVPRSGSSMGWFTVHRQPNRFQFSVHCTHGRSDCRAGTPWQYVYRDVGATLGAVGSARAAEFSSAARVEPC